MNLLRSITEKIFRALYRRSLIRRGAEIADDIQFFDDFFSGEPKGVSIGRGTFIEKGVKIVNQSSELGRTAYLKIGLDCFVNHFTFIDCHHSITIGDHCKIGPYVYIGDFDHIMESNQIICAPVVIESHVWIGAHACILKGTTIGHHSIIAAGAVVSDSIPPFSIAAGVPARVVKKIQSND